MKVFTQILTSSSQVYFCSSISYKLSFSGKLWITGVYLGGDDPLSFVNVNPNLLVPKTNWKLYSSDNDCAEVLTIEGEYLKYFLFQCLLF